MLAIHDPIHDLNPSCVPGFALAGDSLAAPASGSIASEDAQASRLGASPRAVGKPARPRARRINVTRWLGGFLAERPRLKPEVYAAAHRRGIARRDIENVIGVETDKLEWVAIEDFQ